MREQTTIVVNGRKWVETSHSLNNYIEKCKVVQIRSNKKSVFWVTGLKILVKVGTHFFLIIFFFSGKNIILCILKGISPFKMH